MQDFESLISFYGKAGGRNLISSEFRMLYDQTISTMDILIKGNIRHRADNPEKTNIVAGIAADPEVNAVASVVDGVGVIGINVGLIQHAVLLANTFMSHPKILPNLGDAAREKRDVHINWARALRDPDYVSRNIELYSPKDKIRNHLSHLLASSIIEQIFMHEFSHIFNGHINWINAKFGNFYLRELDSRSEEPLRGIDKQTLEFDADSSAFTGLYNVSILKRIADRWAPLLQSSNPIEFAITLRTWAGYLFFRSLECDDVQGNSEYSSHPSSSVRGSMVSTTSHSTFSRDWPELLPHGHEMAFSAVVTADLIFRMISNPGLTIHREDYLRDFQEKHSASSREHRRYLRHWSILRPQLEPLKWGGVLPPVQDVSDD